MKYLQATMNMHNHFSAKDKLPIIPFLILYAIVVFRNAWICDDAYISFRTVDNFIHGYGLTWNAAERVQTYTHPLWLFITIITYRIAGHIYFTCLTISMCFSITAVSLLAFKTSRSILIGCMAILTLTLSEAFIDYSTSGLENPLTFFLIVLFLNIYFTKDLNIRLLFCLSLLSALTALNRLDSILLFLPALAYSLWINRSWRAVGVFILGFTPLIFWELFSMIYYGLPFPNTAFAKLNAGVERMFLIKRGFGYLINTLLHDPLTALIIFAGIVIPFLVKMRKTMLISLGIILMLLYIVIIGGCFMSGRFLGAPFLCAVILLTQHPLFLRKRTSGIILATILLCGIVSSNSPIYSRASDGIDPTTAQRRHYIFDEREFFNQTNGLLNYTRNADFWPSHKWAAEGQKAKEEKVTFLARGRIGLVGFFAGQDVYILDSYALADPFLARLPAHKEVSFKIGHFRRVLPPGYVETLKSGYNHILDKNLAEYFDKICILTRGDLFSKERLIEIVKFNLGYYDHMLAEYRSPHTIHVKLFDIDTPKDEGTYWMELGNVVIDTTGIEIDLLKIYTARQIEMSHDYNDKLRIIYIVGHEKVAVQTLPVEPLPGGGLNLRVVKVPLEAVERGYDRIKIYPLQSDGKYSIGHLRIIEENCP